MLATEYRSIDLLFSILDLFIARDCNTPEFMDIAIIKTNKKDKKNNETEGDPVTIEENPVAIEEDSAKKEEDSEKKEEDNEKKEENPIKFDYAAIKHY